MMEKGEFIRNGYTVIPGENGSFVVYEGSALRSGPHLPACHGFTNHHDLLAWLSSEHSEAKPSNQPVR